MTTYYQTANSYGQVDDPANVPPGATIITLAAYNTLDAAWQTAQTNTATAQLSQRQADYTTVYAALRSAGIPQAAATILAKSIGDTPGTDPELNVKAMTQSTTAAAFTHTITSANGVWEQITELGSITVQESGLYAVDWTARGQVTLPSTSAQAPSALTAVGLFKAAVIIANTETLLTNVAEGNGTEPALGVYVSGSGRIYTSLSAGDVISMYANRTSSSAPAGSVHTVDSAGTTGRSRFSLERVRPN